jgi:hypothetical protein
LVEGEIYQNKTKILGYMWLLLVVLRWGG